MRHRKWILVLASVVSLLMLSGYFSWHLLRANDKIKNILLEKVRPFLAEESDIDLLELDLNSLHLKGVRIVDKQQAFVLEIEDVRLGYQLWNLLRHRFQPHRVAHEMTLFRPQIIIRQIDPQGIADFGGTDLHYDRLVDFIEAVRRISIAEASIVLVDSLENSVRIASDLNGWFQTAPLDSASIRLTGRVLETVTRNLRLEGKINIRNGRPKWVNMVLDETEAPENMPMILPSYVKITSGRLMGKGKYTQENGISGQIAVSDLDVAFKEADLFLQNIQMQSVIERGVAEINGEIGNFNGSKLTVKGHVHRILNPSFDVNVICPAFSLSRFLKTAMPGTQLPIDGQAFLKLDIGGTLSNPGIQGRIEAPDLRVAQLTFDTLLTKVELRDSVFYVDGRAAADAGARIALDGILDFTQNRKNVDVQLDMAGEVKSILPALLQKRIKQISGDSHIRLNGKLGSIQGALQGMFTLVSMNHDTLRLIPRFSYSRRDMQVDIASNRDFHLHGDVLSLFYKDLRWDLQSRGIDDLLLPWTSSGAAHRLKDVAISGHWAGTPGHWQFDSRAVYQPEPTVIRELELKLKAEQDEKQADYLLEGAFTGEAGEQLPVQLKASRQASRFQVQNFNIGSLLHLSGKFDAENRLFEKNRLSVNVPSLTQLHPYLNALKPFTGSVKGELMVQGAADKADWSLSAELREGHGYGQGVLEGEVQCRAKKGQFDFMDLDFRQNDVAILKGSLEPWDEDSLTGGFRGDLIDLGGLLTAISGKKELIEGTGMFDVSVSGLRKCPVFNGSLHAYDGRLNQIGFDELTVVWADTLCFWQPNRLYVNSALLQRKDGLRVEASGCLPLNQKDELDLLIQTDGNMLSLIPEINDFFVAGHGNVRANMRWGGRINDWVLGQFDAEIENGMLEMGTFAGRMKHISGKISLKSEERFLKIERLTGDVKDGRFRIDNQMRSDLYPFVLENIGINLGVFKIETGEKGIPVHVPGLMEPKELVRIDFRGLDGEGPFLIGGPAEHPVLQGCLYLRDGRITYPFLPGNEEDEMDMSFLGSIDWNMHVLPAQDIHYIREIKSPFGNVYTDLKLQDEIGRISVQGVHAEGGLQVWGNLESSEGSIDVLDHYFRPERIVFSYPRGAPPILSGRAYTTLIDSTGMPSTVWLSVNAIDEENQTGAGGVSWDNIQFRFSTDNPNLGRTEADLLAALGYSSENLRDRAYDALGNSVDNLVFRPFIRPLEREMRRYLGLDMVRFSSMFSRNLVQLRSFDNETFDPRILLRSTRLMLGKYLAPGFFISYSGQVQSHWGWQYQAQGLGFRHAVSLEYAIQPDLFLEMEYTYDSQLLHDRREDKRIWLRHTFPF